MHVVCSDEEMAAPLMTVLISGCVADGREVASKASDDKSAGWTIFRRSATPTFVSPVDNQHRESREQARHRKSLSQNSAQAIPGDPPPAAFIATPSELRMRRVASTFIMLRAGCGDSA